MLKFVKKNNVPIIGSFRELNVIEVVIMKNELNEQLDLMKNNIKKLEEIKSYEIAKLIRSYNYQISNLYYYYTVIEKNNKELSKLKKSIKSHTLIYINLGRGFPKELMDGHWCYVVRTIGDSKLFVIPTTSIKTNQINSYMHYIIEAYSKEKNIKSKLELSDIRCVDIQRTYLKKGIYKVRTSRDEIINKLIEMVG